MKKCLYKANYLPFEAEEVSIYEWKTRSQLYVLQNVKNPIELGTFLKANIKVKRYAFWKCGNVPLLVGGLQLNWKSDTYIFLDLHCHVSRGLSLI